MLSPVITCDTPVPFGKYKGQPCSVLLADADYREWVLTQAGIAERFPEIIEFLCQGEGTNDTPDHNALQARLLADDFASALGSFVTEVESDWRAVHFERFGFDAWLTGGGLLAVECKPVLSDDYPAVLRQVSTAIAVTRAQKISSTFTPVVLAGRFQSRAVTLEQAREIFKRSRVVLLTAAEVEGRMLA